MDALEYLTNEVQQKLDTTQYSSNQELAEDIVKTLLSTLESSTPVLDDENIVSSGAQVWATFNGSNSATIQHLREFLTRVESLGIDDSAPVQGSLEVVVDASIDKEDDAQ